MYVNIKTGRANGKGKSLGSSISSVMCRRPRNRRPVLGLLGLLRLLGLLEN
jgi:hypothetical protein